jgi:hypothetical protein
MIKKFIIGINSASNEIQWGDGIIYYQSIPETVEVKRDIRD